jgi:CelD/BcsL family acetyltransferase involved in cellulose biosynthesis
VRWLEFGELEARAVEIDRLVAASPDLDVFCSSSDFILSAREAFSASATPLILETEHGFVTLMRVSLPDGRSIATPLEASWCFASPFAGADPDRLLDELIGALHAPGFARPDLLLLSGIAGRALAAIARRTSRLRTGEATQRIVASLEGGPEGFLARRSPKFRANARRARRLASTRGVVYERHVTFEDVAATYDRILRIERRSYKVDSERGSIADGQMRELYARLFPRLAAHGRLRLVFVTHEGRDVAYCVGGVLGRWYRGLQASYDDSAHELSPGILAHMEMIDLLAGEQIERYDLGADMEYKRRWGEPGLVTQTVLIAL